MNEPELKKAIFLDRDGTLNVDTGYLIHYKDCQWIPGTIQALKNLREAGFMLFIITNQSGIARGYFSEADVHALHRQMTNYLRSSGIKIDDIVICPHHPEGSVPQYTAHCSCRKPAPGMIMKLAETHNIDLTASYTVGDKVSDAVAGTTSGTKGVLVKSGHPLTDEIGSIPVYENLLEFSKSLC